jgi:hypothetical protein
MLVASKINGINNQTKKLTNWQRKEVSRSNPTSHYPMRKPRPPSKQLIGSHGMTQIQTMIEMTAITN